MALRVTFVLPDFPHFDGDYRGTFYHGIASMTSVLRAAGHRVTMIHLSRPVLRDAFLRDLAAGAPDLVAFSTITHFFPWVRSWIGWTREATAAPIVVGGIHAILASEEVIGVPGVDYVCTGEGELTLIELCRRIESGERTDDVTGTWARTSGGVRRNPPRPLIEDLETLPAPDYSVFDYERLFGARHPRLPVMVSRGCSYRCSYCANAQLRSAYPNPRRYTRFLTPETAVGRIADLRARHPATEEIIFNDNIVYPNVEWLRGFAGLYARRVGLPFVANTRPNLVNAEVVDLLAHAGCRRICMGVESGDEDIANRVLKRGLRNPVIRRAFGAFEGSGIQTVAYNILGAPFETRSTMLATVRLNAEIRPTQAAPFIFYPFPGTESHELCRRHGYLTGRHGVHNTDRVMILQPSVTEVEVLFAHRFFTRLVRLYRGVARLPGPVAAPIRFALDRWLGSRAVPRRVLLRARDARIRWRTRGSPEWRFREGADRGAEASPAAGSV